MFMGANKMQKITKNLIGFGIATSLFFSPAMADTKTLTVYTYSSFTSEWGIGAKVKTAFEAECDCTLKYVSLDDGVTMLNRIRLEGEQTQADIAIGLDTNITEAAAATGLFAEHNLDLSALNVPTGWQHKQFVPFDYGYFGFVYNSDVVKNPPTSMQELIDAPNSLKIVIQDPRTSTPGLGLLLWMKKIYGDKAPEMWKKLQPKIVTVTKGWSEAYFSIFLKGEADMVLSYTTSPAYHITAENDDKYKAAKFKEGHYLQIEVAAKLKSSKQQKLADEFLNFITTESFQSLVPANQWMYRLGSSKAGVPKSFDSLISPDPILLFPSKTVEDNRKNWIKEWQSALK